VNATAIHTGNILTIITIDMSYRYLYYLNSTSFLTATAVYQDANLTTLSPDGYYVSGLYVRQQVEGVLLPAQTCPDCPAIPGQCGVSVDVSEAEGVFVTDIDTGTDTGYIVIRFNPNSVPMGIKVEFNGTIYNTFFSGRVGVLTGVANEPVFLGQLTSDCGIVGVPFNPLEYKYISGDYVPDGGYQYIMLESDNLDLTDASPNDCVMVIPKPSASPSGVRVTIFGLCPSGNFFLEVQCPSDNLPEITCSTVQETSDAACSAEQATTFYKINIEGTAEVVAVHDMVFSDHGVTILPTGYYGFGSNWFHINAYGSVDEIGYCT
jgi:hypothetical protein